MRARFRETGRRMAAAAMAGLLLFPDGLARGESSMQQGPVLAAPDGTTVLFEDGGGGGGLFRLHVGDGATTRVLLLRSEAVRPQRVREIHFGATTGQVWISSRLGHRMSGAVLVDLKNGKVEREYCGGAFSVSPDGRHLAFAFPAGRVISSGAAVFVDGLLLYPKIAPGFEHGNLLKGPVKPDGTGLRTLLHDIDSSPAAGMAAPIRWSGSSSLEWLMAGGTYAPHFDEDENALLWLFRADGLSESAISSGTGVTVTRRELTREEFAREWRRLSGTSEGPDWTVRGAKDLKE